MAPNGLWRTGLRVDVAGTALRLAYTPHRRQNDWGGAALADLRSQARDTVEQVRAILLGAVADGG